MGNILRSALQHWADHNTTTAMAARRVRRIFQRVASSGRRQGNVAMLHAGRCGSSVLADLLNQHPDMKWGGEVFESMLPAYYKMDPDRRARERIANSMYVHRSKFFGFDSKYLPEQHLRLELANQTPAQYVALLDDLGFNYFILLNRKNHLRRAVSVAVGMRSGQWNTLGDVRASGKVRLDPERFVSYGVEMPLLQYFANLDSVHAELEQLLSGFLCLKLVYEDDIQTDPRCAYRRTCEFLGLQAQPVDVRLKKMNPKGLADLIENYAEICSLLRNTPYGWMVDE